MLKADPRASRTADRTLLGTQACRCRRRLGGGISGRWGARYGWMMRDAGFVASEEHWLQMVNRVRILSSPPDLDPDQVLVSERTKG